MKIESCEKVVDEYVWIELVNQEFNGHYERRVDKDGKPNWTQIYYNEILGVWGNELIEIEAVYQEFLKSQSPEEAGCPIPDFIVHEMEKYDDFRSRLFSIVGDSEAIYLLGINNKKQLVRTIYDGHPFKEFDQNHVADVTKLILMMFGISIEGDAKFVEPHEPKKK